MEIGALTFSSTETVLSEEQIYTGWAKSSYMVIIYILYTYFWPTL
jgi:hypothetical protein